MNCSRPPPAPFLALRGFRQPVIRPQALILDFNRAVWPGAPCHGWNRVAAEAATPFPLPERPFPAAQRLLEIPQFPSRFVEQAAEVRERIVPNHKDSMSKFT